MIEMLTGAGAAVLGGLVVGGAVALRRVWRSPKRLDRIERLIPCLLRATYAMLVCQKDCGMGNGAVEAALQEVQRLVTDGAVSMKDSR